MNIKVAVVGLGYVGLPLLIQISKNTKLLVMMLAGRELIILKIILIQQVKFHLN